MAFSCKRRGFCPSCGAKRAALTAAHALDHLLPAVDYRQWVLVVPKRLRYFIHRRPELQGEVSRIFAKSIERLIKEGRSGSPAQMHFIQRFGSNLNLHIHIHAVVSEGVFSIQEKTLGRPTLEFHQAPPPSEEDVAAVADEVRKKALKRFVRLGAIPQATADNMLSWHNSGFSVHAQVTANAEDRVGLERLISYCVRPALSLKRLSYYPKQNLTVYQGKEKLSKKILELRLEPKEFLSRIALLCPAPRKNQVRYYGALAPASPPLRPYITKQARQASGVPEPSCLTRAKDIVTNRAKSWAMLLSRVFEINPLMCPTCGGEMRPIAAILDDKELPRLMDYLGLPADFPKTAPARSPPLTLDEDTQIDPALDAWDVPEGTVPSDNQQEWDGIDESPNADENLPA